MKLKSRRQRKVWRKKRERGTIKEGKEGFD